MLNSVKQGSQTQISLSAVFKCKSDVKKSWYFEIFHHFQRSYEPHIP